MRWTPHVTVAAVIERDGLFLFVEERRAEDGKLVLNQPAGHWEVNESLAEGAQRETLEETGWEFTPAALLGIYHWQQGPQTTYVRFAFTGELGAHFPERPLDEGIERAVWLSPRELEAQSARHRSPLVMACVRDYLAGHRLPLTCIREPVKLRSSD